MCEERPSMDIPAGERLRSPICGRGVRKCHCESISYGVHTFSVTIEEEGKTRGLKDKLRGQIGLKTSALKDGWTIGPPADREYAVDPVGVETMRPSDLYQLSIHIFLQLKNHGTPTTASVRCWPSTNMSIVLR